MAQTRTDDTDTKTRILDSAEGLVQRRGFNGWSYADVAAELGITTASLHYHFPGKAVLGQALIDRYATRFTAALENIDAHGANAPARLRAYVDLYADVLRANRMCLCGMLAAEYDTLSGTMRTAVVSFFDDNERWLAGVLDQGRGEGSLRVEGSPEDAARALLSGLEGAMLVARSYGEVARFQAAANRLLTSLAGSS